jgi:hypothetical protein
LAANDLIEIWLELEREARCANRHGILRRRILPEAECDLFVAVEWPSGRRVLLVRVGKENAGRARELQHSKGFELDVIQLPDDPDWQISVCLALTESRFSDVFASLAADVSNTLLHLHGDTSIVDGLVIRLKRWQAFLNRHLPEGLGEEAQRGLFGELWFLRKHLLQLLLAEQAVAAWKGPTRAVHDFQLPGTSIEVKTTVSRQHTKLCITGERQLDDAKLENLFLFHLAIEQRELGKSLPELVADIRERLADCCAREKFEDLLLESGYLDGHANNYSQPYIFRESHYFRVIDGFPRLTDKQLPLGVGDLSYTITLGQCMNFLISELELESIIRAAYCHR